MIDLDDDIIELLEIHGEIFVAFRALGWAALQANGTDKTSLIREIAELADDFHNVGHIVKLNKLAKKSGDYEYFAKWLGQQAGYARRGADFENKHCVDNLVRWPCMNVAALYEKMIQKIEAA